MDKKIATVHDVARIAGVSRGTVDRVVHGRGRVSPETVERVRKAIDTLGYSANPNASSLASRKEYRIACLIPEYSKGEYWELIHKGLKDGADETRTLNVSIETYFYDQTDSGSFCKAAGKILESAPSGVIMNAVFKDAVSEFALKLKGAQIPYIFLDNKVDGLGNEMYIGIDPYKSGQLGAFLLTAMGAKGDIVMVRLLRDKGYRADPNEERRRGFSDYIQKNLPDTTVHTLFIDPTDSTATQETLGTFFKAHPEVCKVVMTNSRIHLIGSYLREHPDSRRVTVGFDDLENNLALLKEGLVDFLVTHQIRNQARTAVSLFADYLARSGSTSSVRCNADQLRKNHYIHLDILHRFNVDDYA